jgi:8-oxo-dGTP diphosphatase
MSEPNEKHVLKVIPQNPMIEFGDKIEGVEYTDLPCARGVVRNGKGEFAFVDVKGQYFLLGGGIEKGESPEQALVREFQEEIGAKVIIGKKIGMAADYVFGKSENAYFRKVGTFFEAQIDGEVSGGIEPDHALVWATFEEAEPMIKQKSQAWAIQQLLSK